MLPLIHTKQFKIIPSIHAFTLSRYSGNALETLFLSQTLQHVFSYCSQLFTIPIASQRNALCYAPDVSR